VTKQQDMLVYPESSRSGPRTFIIQYFPRRAGLGVVLALLCFFGALKGTPLLSFLPSRATLVVGLLVAALAGKRLLIEKVQLWGVVSPIVTFWYCLMPGAIIAFIGDSVGKSLELYTWTLMCCIAGLIAGQRRDDIVGFFGTVCVLGGLAAVGLALFPGRDYLEVDRLTIEGATSIDVARLLATCGISILAAGLYNRGFIRYFAWVALALVVALLTWIGSRGPLLAFVIAVLAMMVAGKMNWKSVATVFGGAAVLGVILQQSESAKYRGGIERVFGADGSDDLTTGRSGLYEFAATQIVENPVGIGWGSFRDFLSQAPGRSIRLADYPHNVFLEIALEGGWIAGVGFVILLWKSFSVLRSLRVGPFHTLVVGFLTLWLVAALFSSSMTGNRPLWVAIGMALGLAFSMRVNGNNACSQGAIHSDKDK
jgi:O-antigen ligase